MLIWKQNVYKQSESIIIFEWERENGNIIFLKDLINARV